MQAIKDRVPVGPAVEADLAAIPVSADHLTNAEEGVPLLPLRANSRAAQVYTKLAQWLAVLSRTALAL
jgi:hypothetical protein